LDRQNSIPDELPPALPVKRRMEQRYRNSSLHDVNDFATPSGTPPPPYGLEGQRGQRVPKSGSFNGLSVGPRVHPFHQLDIMTAEESSFHINQGPFSEYFALQRNLPHLAVFLNFLLASNIDDSIPLLFHLITDIYQKGNSKVQELDVISGHNIS
jgi:Regulator of G protein signalling-like domain